MDLLTLLQKLKPILDEEATNRAWEQLQLADPKTAKLLEFSLRKRLADATGTSFEEREILLEPIPFPASDGPIRLGLWKPPPPCQDPPGAEGQGVRNQQPVGPG